MSANKLPALLLALCVGLIAAAGTVHADTTTVSASGFSFIPPHIIVNVGDTVKWVQVSGSHTVTSGTGSADPGAGDLFNGSLGFGQQFFHTFNDTTGVYPYYCIPHEFLGMKGTVTVEGNATNVQEPSFEATSWTELKTLFND